MSVQSSSNFRDIFQIVKTSGYITVIEGEPGSGKTSLALASSLASGLPISYISYNEPESSLIEKARRVSAEDQSRLKVFRILSGSSDAFSIITESLKEGKLVVVDSIDAFLAGVSGQQPERVLLQLLYEAAKSRNGSLILISEGLSDSSALVRFVADALIKVELVNVLGLNARRFRVLKDRDYPVSVYPFYFTFQGGLQVFSASYDAGFESIMQTAVKPWERPYGERSVLKSPEVILYSLSESVGVPFARLYRLWLAVDYLSRGYNIAFITRPDEDERSVAESLARMSGKETGFEVLRASGRLEVDLEELKRRGCQLVIADSLGWEGEAAYDPSSYESGLRELVERNVRCNRGAFIFAYDSYSGLKIIRKYAARERALAGIDNYVFLRTIRPLGPLYLARVESAGSPELKLVPMY